MTVLSLEEAKNILQIYDIECENLEEVLSEITLEDEIKNNNPQSQSVSTGVVCTASYCTCPTNPLPNNFNQPFEGKIRVISCTPYGPPIPGGGCDPLNPNRVPGCVPGLIVCNPTPILPFE